MFFCHHTVKMSDTDATGFLYFANQQVIAVEAFEKFLAQEKISLHEWVFTESFAIPIVESTSQFFAPVTLGDTLKISLSLKKEGQRSFTLAAEFFKGDRQVGQTSITHVAIDKASRESILLPKKLKDLLAKLCLA